jgi:hypothetical protein
MTRHTRAVVSRLEGFIHSYKHALVDFVEARPTSAGDDCSPTCLIIRDDAYDVSRTRQAIGTQTRRAQGIRNEAGALVLYRHPYAPTTYAEG